RRASVDKDFNTEAYDAQEENPFLDVKGNPLSTFSIDVDTASYANVRRFISHGQLPPKGSVRIEEMLNYFSYDYPAPTDNTPFSTSIEAAECPWQPEHRLVRIGLRGRDVPSAERPTGNLVFLIDVSGSMEPANKLPLLRQSLRLLADQLGENDRVAIAVYAGNSGLVLPSTSDKRAIKDALDRLEAGGSTNGAAGIQLAYDEATKNFIKGGINRVILATDGDFNVGITNQSDLVDLIQKKAKTGVFLSVLGFGEGNLKDSTMEKLADKGNGNYAYIDTIQEGRKVLVEQLGGTLVTIAKDVKIQVEFNPAVVAQYRLIGYENRILAKEDFNDDTKDAGEIGANHTVTALYELVPAGKSVPTSTVDPLKYQPAPDANPQSEAPGKSAGRTEVTGQRSVLPNSQPDEQRSTAESKIENPKPKMSELLTVKLRYKQPDSEVSTRVEFPFTDPGAKLTSATPDFRFAAAVAEAGLLLKDSAHKQLASWNSAIELASKSIGDLRNKKQDRYREEFVALARRARDLSHHSEE
ncbi:MAG TPA: VWA domain-containing protein, partial [Chthoniobacterales bacterium]